jgi:transcriptional regulatory protein RtcR
MSREARDRFLEFASGFSWPGNFRGFNAAITRMATLAPGGRITVEIVAGEIGRLREAVSIDGAGDVLARVLGSERAARLDRFDRVQLGDVLAVCKEASSLSAAGRALFAASRAEKRSVNDADRLRKYLAKFGLEFSDTKQTQNTGEPTANAARTPGE